MPRIDPLQLLKCLSVLLTPEGGILSRDEVPRLVNLMTKFSKKLVSKCVYVLILKSTETELVDMFMAEGGWTLIQTWLQDAVQTANWDLVREILGLLLVTPVDVERLKLNILPKLIKSLSRREELEGVAELSARLVQQWLSIVKGSSNAAQVQPQLQQPAVPVTKSEEISDTKQVIETPVESVETEIRSTEDKDVSALEYVDEIISTDMFYRNSGRNSKIIGKKSPLDENKDEAKLVKDEESKDEKDGEKEKNKDRRSSSSKSSRSSSGRSSSSSKDKDKDKKSSSSKISSSKISSSSKSKDKDKDRKDKEKSKDRDRDRDRDRDKDKHRKNGEVKSSSSSSKSSKDRRDSKDKDKEKSKHKSDKGLSKDKQDDDKQAEKDKDTLAKLIPPPIDKLGRIPKKSSASSSNSSLTPAEEKEKKELELKKKSFSVGIRKDRDNNEERPKTVKVFNSKMRSTGLEEEIKPAPLRSSTGKKPTPSVQLPTIPQKRPSPPKEIRDPIVPPEKKLKIDKIDVPERPGAIKLIPPKPKPMLQESDLFNDALTAATTKKEPKKRKRRASLSKDKETPTSPSSSPANESPATPTSPTGSHVGNSTLGLKNIAPINFYQDTLSSEEAEEKEYKDTKEDNDDENKENASENVDEKANTAADTDETKMETPSSPPKTPTDDNDDEPLIPKRIRMEDGLKGVLLYSKKRGPKKSISWKNDADLVDIRYFELDETERVNVTKTFGDMAKMDISSEREALQLSRKVGGEDLMESQINWRVPFLLEVEEPLAAPGSKSLEKDIQFAREKSVLQALYFDKRRIPDSPEEPIPENHQMSDPVLILLEDPESQEIDLRSTPWPEPKGMPPQPEPKPVTPVFQSMPIPFQPPFNNMAPPNFPGMPPRFVAPGGPMGHAGPGNFIPPNMMAPNNVMVPPNMGPQPHEMMNMNPNMFPHGPAMENFVPGPENFAPMHDGFGPPGPDCFGPSVPEGFGPPGSGPDGFGPPGPDFPMFPNQNQPNNMNMFHPNKFRDHRPNNRGGFRRGGGGNSGGWKQVSGNNNWKKGRGGRLCKHVQNHGFCRNRDTCSFMHP